MFQFMPTYCVQHHKDSRKNVWFYEIDIIHIQVPVYMDIAGQSYVKSAPSSLKKQDMDIAA